MINYFAAAERMLRARPALDKALANLERRKGRIILQGCPAGLPSPDLTKPYSSTKDVNDALSDCLEITEITREIYTTRQTINEIDEALAQLERDDERVLRLWYIERASKEEIAETVKYSSTTSIYDIRNRAVGAFALLYYGAGAIAST